MSTALAQNATDFAATGFNLDELDSSRIRAIVIVNAKTKTGGFNFQPGVLFTKVCKEIKSLASMNKGAPLPEKLAKLIHAEVAALPSELTKSLGNEDYRLIKQGAMKINVSVRELAVTRRVEQLFEKLTSLEDQEKDLRWLLFQMIEKKEKLGALQFKDADHRARVENQIASLENKIATYQKLHKVLKMEIEEQRKATVESK